MTRLNSKAHTAALMITVLSTVIGTAVAGTPTRGQSTGTFLNGQGINGGTFGGGGVYKGPFDAVPPVDQEELDSATCQFFNALGDFLPNLSADAECGPSGSTCLMKAPTDCSMNQNVKAKPMVIQWPATQGGPGACYQNKQVSVAEISHAQMLLECADDPDGVVRFGILPVGCCDAPLESVFVYPTLYNTCGGAYKIGVDYNQGFSNCGNFGDSCFADMRPPSGTNVEHCEPLFGDHAWIFLEADCSCYAESMNQLAELGFFCSAGGFSLESPAFAVLVNCQDGDTTDSCLIDPCQ